MSVGVASPHAAEAKHKSNVTDGSINGTKRYNPPYIFHVARPKIANLSMVSLATAIF